MRLDDGVTEGSCGPTMVLLRVVSIRRWLGSGGGVPEGNSGQAMVFLRVVAARR